jgi:hypothetical protein
MSMHCNLPEGALAQRRVEIQQLFKGHTGVARHPDGVELRWTFSEETARTLLEFVFFERVCCPTFTYELGFVPPQEHITLRVRAPAEQVEALQAFYC